MTDARRYKKRLRVPWDLPFGRWPRSARDLTWPRLPGLWSTNRQGPVAAFWHVALIESDAPAPSDKVLLASKFNKKKRGAWFQNLFRFPPKSLLLLELASNLLSIPPPLTPERAVSAGRRVAQSEKRRRALDGLVGVRRWAFG